MSVKVLSHPVNLNVEDLVEATVLVLAILFKIARTSSVAWLS